MAIKKKPMATRKRKPKPEPTWRWMLANNSQNHTDLAFQLVLVDADGNILERDGVLAGCKPNHWPRVAQAMAAGKVVVPSVTKAVEAK